MGPRVSLHRIFWAWHFWIGVLLGPFVSLVACTGGMYVFKKELELWWYADQMGDDRAADWCHARPDNARQPLTALAAMAPGIQPLSWELERGSGRLPAIVGRQVGSDHVRRFYLEPDFSSIRSEAPREDFFTWVLAIHRGTVAGLTGRILVELTTSWLVITSLVGAYLWWPRRWKWQGVLLPRWRAKAYVRYRDMHAILGMIAILFLLLASVSGLVYSQIAGSIVNGIGFFSGQYDIFLEEVASPSLTKASRDHEPEADRRIEDAIRGLSIAQQIEPRLNRLTVQLPGTPTGSLTVEAGADWGPSIQAVYRYDRGTGKLFSQTNVHELPPMAIGLMWNYPIHVGSVLGLYSQWFWFASALIVTALPWLGYLMTWLRKRRSTSLVPRSDAPLPNGIVGTLVILGVVFPTVGVTLIGFLILSVFRESKFGSTARSNRN